MLHQLLLCRRQLRAVLMQAADQLLQFLFVLQGKKLLADNRHVRPGLRHAHGRRAAFQVELQLAQRALINLDLLQLLVQLVHLLRMIHCNPSLFF